MYKEMVDLARVTGYANERTMDESIQDVDELLERIKEPHAKVYWDFMRKAHERLFGSHYDSIFADIDVNKLRYTDKDGAEHTGAHWTKEQVIDALKEKTFATGVTECDKFVAANVMYSDLCRKFDDQQILEAAYLFFFNDEDWNGGGKIWEYMKH